jgi:hypothetical protein
MRANSNQRVSESVNCSVLARYRAVPARVRGFELIVQIDFFCGLYLVSDMRAVSNNAIATLVERVLDIH